MTDTTAQTSASQETLLFYPFIETYRTWVDTLTTYMKRAAQLLESLYTEQDQIIDQLRKLCAKTHSLRHADFDSIFGKILADRRKTRESSASLVDRYRAGREAIIREVQAALSSEMSQAVQSWPLLKQRLLGEQDDGMCEIIAALRQVHIEQQKISTALSGLLMRGDKLKVEELKTVAQRLASRDSQESAELAALLAVCESAGRDVGMKWQRLAG